MSFFSFSKLRKDSSGFTLIEVMIVIALMALVYSLVIPRFTTDASAAFNSLSRLSNDVRSAFDTAVLTGKTHRLVFNLRSGKYWLEVTDADDVYLGAEVEGTDLNESLLEEQKENFELRFEKYKDLAGEAVKDDEEDAADIPPPSPVMKAKDKLKGPTWRKVESLEWGNRQLVDILIINDIKAEHHASPITLEDHSADDEIMATIQVMPSGYIEQTIFHIYYRKGENEANFDRKPFTLLIHPTLGIANYVVGLKEIDEDGQLNESEFL